MKSLIFKTVIRLAVSTAVLFSLYTTAKAEESDYSPLLTDGKVWIFELPASFLGKGIILMRMSITVGEDIEYEGQKGKRVHIDCLDDIPEMEDILGWGDDSYDLFEIDRVVYCHVPRHDIWIYLLPFNLEPGDKVYIHDSEGYQYGEYPISVKSKDSFSLNGKTYKRWITDTTLWQYDPDTGRDYETNKYDTFVEGIGNICGIIPYINSYDLFPECMDISTPRLLEVYENGELIFSYDDFFTDLPEAGMAETCTAEVEDIAIYDLLGHKLSHKPGKGIYICNRKKCIAE